MKLYTSEQYFDYSWDQVTAANWVKYPNEVSTHVVGVDVLRREFYPDTGILKTERLITCKQPIPKWLSCLVGGVTKSYVREVSTIDRNNKTLTMKSCNLTYSNLLKVYETVVYSPDSANPDHKTKFEQTAEVTAYASFSRICDKLENWGVERFGQNAIKGKLGFDSVLSKLDAKFNLGDTIDEWTDKTNVVFKEVSEKTGDVIDEVNAKTNEFVKGLDAKTSEVLNDTNEVTQSVLWQVTKKVKEGIFHK